MPAHLDRGVWEEGVKGRVDCKGDSPQLDSASAVKGAASKAAADVKDAHAESKLVALIKHLLIHSTDCQDATKHYSQS